MSGRSGYPGASGRLLRSIALLTAACALLAATVPATASAGPVSDFYRTPGIPPPGANDFSCRGEPGKRIPVVLVHGTFGDMTVSWNRISPALVRAGYCVFALDLVKRATAPIQDSTRKVKRFIERVRDRTGARRVSIVGHSQGGMLPRYLIKTIANKRKIAEVIGLSPSNHGTTTPLSPPAGVILDCPACRQQVRGSPFMQRLNSGDQTPGRADYTVIQTRYDEVVTPYTSAFLPGSPEQVTNVLLQRRCPNVVVEHNGIIYDRAALQWVRNALGRDGPARASFRPNC